MRNLGIVAFCVCMFFGGVGLSVLAAGKPATSTEIKKSGCNSTCACNPCTCKTCACVSNK